MCSLHVFAAGILALGAAGAEVSPCGEWGGDRERSQSSQTSQAPAAPGVCAHARSCTCTIHTPHLRAQRGLSEVRSGPLCAPTPTR